MSKPKRYDPATIETKWQSRWENEKTYACHVDKDKKKYYMLEMFPYPSGNLHMGHVRNYSIGDVVARFKRMQGFNVMHPMGWDAFGLPAENAAIKHNIHPSVWTHANIDNMRAQLKRLGYSYDWDREVATCDEPYYRWEQLFFLRWLEKGLVYRKKASQNWCPHCNTVLANEQVVDGLCWRCDTPVVQKELTQWFLKITDYADELLADLSKLEGGWPDRVLSMQRNWIGKSVGAEITFPLESGEGDIKVFTTRPDTVFGVTFMTLAPEHPLVESLISGKPNEAEARAFIERTHNMDRIDRQSDSLEKEGVFTGSYCLNPFTGRQVPIWLGNFVLAEYGTGAVMAVPAHDQRDFDFSKKYGMERIVVIQPEGEAPLTPENLTEAYTAPGVLVNSGEFDGLPNEDAKKAIADALEASGKGKRTTNWRLRDWNISRQRYWGAPIPVVYCDTCGMVPVPEDQLPVRLPLDVQTHTDGKSPLPHTPEFYNCTCPKCGGAAKRETDTMDTFDDSSWYFQRYCSPDCSTAMVDKRADYWMPMDQYIGGIEHAVLHLLYARFWTKVMRDLGLVKYDEPFKNLFTQGMLMADCYYRNGDDGRKVWFYPDEVEVQYDEKGRPVGAVCKADGQPVTLGGIEKMSKSKNNVVEPREIIKKFGADTARSFVMFAGPPDQSAAWSNSGAEGTYRFLRRIWNWAFAKKNLIASAGAFEGQMLPHDAKTLRREVHTTLRQAEYDFSRMQYNTVVSACMKMFNTIEGFKGETPADLAALCECASILLRTLYPIAPHITTALWQELGFVERIGDLIDAPWPEVSEDAIKADELKLVVQVNGKLRGEILVPAEAAQAEIEAAALANPDVQRFTEGMTVRKIIIVKNKLVNVVVAK